MSTVFICFLVKRRSLAVKETVKERKPLCSVVCFLRVFKEHTISMLSFLYMQHRDLSAVNDVKQKEEAVEKKVFPVDMELQRGGRW